MPSVDYVKMIITFVGGLGLFIYGMHIMASGLQKSAGSKMKRLLEIITSSKILGVFVGILFTAIIQSSSATTVMVVGFVNAGLMNIYQSVGVIMGANVGTTVTGWLVSSVEWAKYLTPSTLAPIAVGIGTAMAIFPKKDKPKQIGQILVGFGILFIGMNTMSGAVSPLKESEMFKELFLSLGRNPILGVLAGTLITGIVQSSSASVGILQSLALSNLVPVNAAVYIIMGQNIGTCVTALLSGIGASKMAKSAAFIHLLFNVIGSIIFSIAAVVFFTYVNPKIGNELITLTQISFVHTGFNVLNTIMFYPFSDILVRMALKMASVKDEEESSETSLVHLDERVLEAPSFAIENCIKEIVRMGKITGENLSLAKEALLEKNEAKAQAVLAREENIDTIAEAITGFIIKLCNTEVSEEQNEMITNLFHTVNDVERVGDHCENIAELALILIETGSDFSKTAKDEINDILKLTINCYKNSIETLEMGSKELARKVREQEESVDILEKKLRERHISRLSGNECEPNVGVVFLDAITNLERISDHAVNIADYILHEKHKKNYLKIEGRK